MIVYKLEIVFVFCFYSILLIGQEEVFEINYSNKFGIDFQNEIIETLEQNIFNDNMPYLYAGGGVAIEDFNNDGLPDIFLLGNQVSSKIFINKGNLRFEDRSQEMNINTSNWCTSILLCDVNMDGYKDVYILKAPNNSNEVSHNLLFVNVNGDYFIESSKKYNLDFNGGFLSGSFFDFDLDGDQDLYLARYPNNIQNNNLSIDYDDLVNNEYGNDIMLENMNNKIFKDVTKQSGLKQENGFGISVLTSDFNSDGLIDIYVGNDFEELDFLYINKGSGKFEESIRKYFNHTSLNTMGTDYADLNNDGLFDIISLDMNPPELSKYKIDFSSLDFSIYNKLKKNGVGQEIRNTLQIQNEDGTYTDIAQKDKIAFTDWSWSSIICDFNLDGYKDIFITNGLKKDILNQEIHTNKLDSIMKSEFLSDTNFDNVKILSYIPSLKLNNYFFKNNGDLSFQKVNSLWLKKIASVSNGSAIGDLDLDGDIDIVVNNIDTFPLIYKNLSSLNKKFVSFTTKDYSFLNTKVTLIDSLGFELKSELRNCKGFISSSQPIVTFPLTKENISVYSFKIDFLNENKTYYSTQDIREDTIYFVEDFFERAISRKSNLKGNLYKTELVTSLYSNLPNFRKAPFLIKADVFEQLVKKINIGYDNFSEIYLGARLSNQAKIVSLNSKEEIKVLELNDVSEIDLDLVQINENEFFLLSRNQEFENVIYHLKWNENDFIKIKLWEGRGNLHKLGILKDDKPILLVFGGINISKYPLSYKNLVFGFENNVLAILENRTEELNKLLASFSIKDVESAIKYEKIYLAGLYMKPSYIELNKQKKFSLISLSNQRGYFDNVCYDVSAEKVLFSNLSENIRFNLKSEDSLVLYTYDFDINGKIDPLLCSSISGVDYPIYAYNTMTKYLSGIKKYIPVIKKYNNSSIQEIFKDVDFSKVQKNTITCIENLLFDVETNNSVLIKAQTNSFNNIQSYKNNLIFSGGTNLLMPTLGNMDFAELIITNKNEKEKIFNSFVEESFIKNIFILNQNIPILFLQTKDGLYFRNIKNVITD